MSENKGKMNISKQNKMFVFNLHDTKNKYPNWTIATGSVILNALESKSHILLLTLSRRSPTNPLLLPLPPITNPTLQTLPVDLVLENHNPTPTLVVPTILPATKSPTLTS